ncbi:MAG TPA: bifunctional DNA primase/polymerase [Candidatus Accumulibacter phosphatis]|nr:bifunctional DNA primase/polymerase [Candidatus Accumulibacter phosphatis]
MGYFSDLSIREPKQQRFTGNDHGAQYWFDFGLRVIPIVPGTKQPAVPFDPWLANLSLRTIWRYWKEHPDHQVGCVLGPELVGLDADSANAKAALYALEKKHRAWPQLVVKTGRGEHHYFRLAPGTHVRSDSHSSAQYPDRIDVKADRGQLVLPPSARKRIGSLGTYHVSGLTVVDQAFIDSVFLHNGREAPRPAAARAADESPVTQTPIKEIAALLKHLDASCGHDDWVRVLMAVYHETQGSEAGLELANEWSRPGSTYKGRRDIETQWRSFRSDHPNPITVGTLIKMAREAGADTNAIMQTGEKFELCEYEAVEPGSAPPAAVADDTPLRKYSLLGRSDELEKQSVGQVTIFGDMILQGQASVIYAKPNTGKTLLACHLIVEAIQAKRIDPSKVYYINMDDNGHGLAEKNRIADEFGFHMLAEGHREFQLKAFYQAVEEMIATDTARGVIIVLDTLRKFVDTMSKDKSAAFGAFVRRFVMRGGTVVALAHTNKNPGADGKPVFAGTTDIVDSFDCAFTLAAVPQLPGADRKVVVFENIKRRGNVALTASYSYASEPRTPYIDLVLSVEEVSAEQLLPIQQAAEIHNDDGVIKAVAACIGEGINTKMSLRNTAAERANVSRQAVLKVIEKYTGDDSAVHRWTFAVGERGAKIYALLSHPTPNS